MITWDVPRADPAMCCVGERLASAVTRLCASIRASRSTIEVRDNRASAAGTETARERSRWLLGPSVANCGYWSATAKIEGLCLAWVSHCRWGIEVYYPFRSG